MARDGQTIDSFYRIALGCEEHALKTRIFVIRIIIWDKLINNAIAKGAMALVGGNLSLHGVSV